MGPISILFGDCIFMSTSPCVCHTSSAMHLTLLLYLGAKGPPYNDKVKSIVLIVTVMTGACAHENAIPKQNQDRCHTNYGHPSKDLQTTEKFEDSLDFDDFRTNSIAWTRSICSNFERKNEGTNKRTINFFRICFRISLINFSIFCC